MKLVSMGGAAVSAWLLRTAHTQMQTKEPSRAQCLNCCKEDHNWKKHYDLLMEEFSVHTLCKSSTRWVRNSKKKTRKQTVKYEDLEKYIIQQRGIYFPVHLFCCHLADGHLSIRETQAD